MHSKIIVTTSHIFGG